jgi:hypothetical protein
MHHLPFQLHKELTVQLAALGESESRGSWLDFITPEETNFEALCRLSRLYMVVVIDFLEDKFGHGAIKVLTFPGFAFKAEDVPRIAGCRITPVLGFWALRVLHWVKFTFETGFELPSSLRRLPCYGASTNRNILDFMK